MQEAMSPYLRESAQAVQGVDVGRLAVAAQRVHVQLHGTHTVDGGTVQVRVVELVQNRKKGCVPSASHLDESIGDLLNEEMESEITLQVGVLSTRRETWVVVWLLQLLT